MIRRSMIQRICKRLFSRVTLLAVLGGIGVTSMPAVSEAQTLLQANARYPRVRMLQSGELIATVLLFPSDYRVRVFSSVNNGASWTAVGIVDDPEFVKGTSSPNFILLPNNDLLLAINVDTLASPTRQNKIKIYKSTDNGRNWTYLSTAATSPNNLTYWEPDLSIATDGSLVLHYADMTSACCSQKLVRVKSTDNGATWPNANRLNTVALGTAPTDLPADPYTIPNYNLRPGMPVVSKLTNGSGLFLLTYEVCNLPGENGCRSYYKTSADGWNYGATNTIGTVMQHADGRFWRATPINKALPGGPLLWMGKSFRTSAGGATGNGTVISKSVSGSPNGPWTTINAPVTLSNPTTAGCQGFSPAIQWVNGGSTIVQLQMRPSTTITGNCDIWVGTGPS